MPADRGLRSVPPGSAIGVRDVRVRLMRVVRRRGRRTVDLRSCDALPVVENAVVDVDGGRFEVARAVEADVPELVALLTDDALGATREASTLRPYLRAFREIDVDDNQLLVAVRDDGGNLVATMQLTLIPGLARGGTKRLQIEAVRVASTARRSGLGSVLFEGAHAYGARRGASLAQLTSDKVRIEAHRFYARLGYEATHEGFKRAI
jgi:GNAT superfamily N-acetyltransferase